MTLLIIPSEHIPRLLWLQSPTLCCAGYAGRVHFVGHSLGGLLIRAYLQNKRMEKLGRFVLIGTPNRGSELVDRFRDNWHLSLFGPTTAALGTGSARLPARLL